METAVVSENDLLEGYVAEINSKLSPNARLELIIRLTQTLKDTLPIATGPKEVQEPRKTLLDFAGIWANDPDAKVMEEAIQQGRTSVSKPYLENWD